LTSIYFWLMLSPMSSRTLLVQPLTQQAFSPYGDVLGGEVGSGLFINGGTSEKIALGDPVLTSQDGEPSLNLYRARANPLPFTAVELERHCIGSQSFIPLAGVPFVVIVALGDPATGGKTPLESSIAAFWIDGSFGVTFKPATWHHPLLSQRDGDYVVLERRGRVVDCEIQRLKQPVEVRCA
jgi:ureidoglycolate lyase